jgi:hypothetical protein
LESFLNPATIVYANCVVGAVAATVGDEFVES